MVQVPEPRTARAKDTLYPKITGKYEEFLAGLRKLKRNGHLPAQIDMEGTVKLHGMHADIVYDLKSSESNTFPKFQSRNRSLQPHDDCQGWPVDITSQPSSVQAFEYLKQRIFDRFSQQDADTPVEQSSPLIVAGEWIGATCKEINGQWQRDAHFADIEVTKAGIYSIFRGSQTKIKLHTADLSENNPALFQMQRLADQVEAACPFAAAFGVKDSRGEGVVWKPGVSEGRRDARYWFKTKGPISGPENRIDPARIAAQQIKNRNIAELCAGWVTPRRTEQAFEFLNEMELFPTPASLKEFQKWMVNDIAVEERIQIEGLKSTYADAESLVKRKVEQLAMEAYLAEAERCGVDLAWALRFEQ